MSVFKKIKRRVDKTFRKVGLSRKASKVARQLVTGDVVGLARSAQRSHKFGKVGKTLAPSMSTQNQITKAWSKIQNSLARTATRSALRSETNNSASSYSKATFPSDSLNRRVDYSYRRLKDIS